MAYFDNAATTYPKPKEVYDKAFEFYRANGFNAGRSNNEGEQKAAAIIADTRAEMLKLLDAEGTHQTIFSPSATIALNVILQGLDYSKVKYVYISPFEHNAVTRTLNAMSKRYKFKIEQLAVNKRGIAYDIDKIKAQFQTHFPDIVVLTHASNACGAIAPVKTIFTAAKKHNATTICDMAQTAGLIETSLKDCNIDIAVFAGHKSLFAFPGAAGFILKKGIDLKPLYFGGTGRQSEQIDMPETLPDKFEAGSPDILAIASLHFSLKWINEKGVKIIEKTEKECYTKLRAMLDNHSNIKLVGVADETVGIISCTFDSYSPDNIGQILSERNIAVRTGLHCSPYAHKFLGTFPAGTVRFSVNCFNTDKDLEELKVVLDYIEENT